MKTEKLLALPNKIKDSVTPVAAESLINMFNSNFSELKTILEMAKVQSSKDNKWRQ